MAVQISISMDDVYDEAQNTNFVTIALTATWENVVSYNKNAQGSLTVNGVTYPFTASINASQTLNGSELIYSTTVAIDRSITDTLVWSYFIAVGGTTGDTSDSGELPLRGGSSGGGDVDPDEPDEPDNPDDPIMHKIIVLSGEHTKITLYNATQGYEIQNGTSVRDEYKLLITVSVDNGYVLSYCTVNGVEIEPNSVYTVYNNITIETAAILPVVYIDTEFNDYTQHAGDCTFNGHAYISGTDNASAPSYSTTGTKYMGYNANGTPNRAVYFLKFTTPNFDGWSEYMRFIIPFSSGGFSSGKIIKYWITSSDSNYLLYAKYSTNGANTDEIVNDENIVIYGVYTATSTVYEIDLTIPITGLEKNTTYYLILYAPYQGSTLQKSLKVPTNIIIGSFSDPVIGTHIERLPYQCYIDSDDGWDLYIPYIDTDTGWEVIA